MTTDNQYWTSGISMKNRSALKKNAELSPPVLYDDIWGSRTRSPPQKRSTSVPKSRGLKWTESTITRDELKHGFLPPISTPQSRYTTVDEYSLGPPTPGVQRKLDHARQKIARASARKMHEMHGIHTPKYHSGGKKKSSKKVVAKKGKKKSATRKSVRRH